MLKLGDFGKIESFIERVEKTLNKEIVNLNKNIETAKINTSNEVDELEDQLEDAVEDLANTYLDIDPSNVATNDAQKEFLEVYLKNSKDAKNKVAKIEKSIAEHGVALNKTIEAIKEEIKDRKEIIKSITV